jgi:hypothetical protein
MLGLNFWESETFLNEHGTLLHYDEQELENQVATLNALESP